MRGDLSLDDRLARIENKIDVIQSHLGGLKVKVAGIAGTVALITTLLAAWVGK